MLDKWIATESLNTSNDHIWNNAPNQNYVFGFDVELRCDKAIQLDHKEFKDQGGLVAFQKRVAKKLGLKVTVEI